MSLPDEDYLRNTPYAFNYISTVLLKSVGQQCYQYKQTKVLVNNATFVITGSIVDQHFCLFILVALLTNTFVCLYSLYCRPTLLFVYTRSIVD
jgi:hypothetical protein